MGQDVRFRRSSAGFSLIELLVTISIIGLLASIGTAVATRMNRVARADQVRSMMIGLIGAHEEFKAVRKESLNHSGSYPIDWPSITNGSKFSSSERFVYGCSQIKKVETMMAAAINSGSSASNDKLFNDTNGNGAREIYDRWGTQIEYRSKNDGKGSGPQTGVSNAKLPLSKFPFMVSAGPDKVFDTADDITTVDN